MARVHLIELEDLPFFPAILRDPMTDFLSFLGENARSPYRAFVGRLRRAMDACGADRLLDLCSGGGGPAWAIAQILGEPDGRPVKVTLTDLYPSLARFERLHRISSGAVDYRTQPVDCTQVPKELPGFRLLCNGFHHLQPEQARRVLQGAVDSRQGIAIFEAIERSLPGAVQLVFSLATMLVVTPFIRPFRLSRLLLTYVIPAIPLCTLWDGVVSILRIYSPGELRALVAELPPSDYVWDIGQARVPGTPMRVTFLIGHPPAQRSADAGADAGAGARPA